MTSIDSADNSREASRTAGRESLEDWLRRIIRSELRDVGDGSCAQAGIWLPASTADSRSAGVTEQFLQGAADYHIAYFQTEYWTGLIRAALDRAGVQCARVEEILDVGSGSGNTVIPLAELCPRARIAACDVSPQLLGLLGAELRSRDLAHRVALACLDLNQPWFANSSFDLAVGGAILHHLFDPARMLDELFQTVRAGGTLIFFEPFELGYKLVAICYQRILEAGTARPPLAAELRGFLERRLAEFALRSGGDGTRERLHDVDDKWLFTRSYFESIARRIGARELLIDPIQGPDSMLEKQIRFELLRGGGYASDALPSWAWDLVVRTQEAFSPELRSEIPIEARIIFRK